MKQHKQRKHESNMHKQSICLKINTSIANSKHAKLMQYKLRKQRKQAMQTMQTMQA
jgi:hypothetical protein